MTIKIQKERGVVKINWNKFSELFEISDDEKEFFEMLQCKLQRCHIISLLRKGIYDNQKHGNNDHGSNPYDIRIC